MKSANRTWFNCSCRDRHLVGESPHFVLLCQVQSIGYLLVVFFVEVFQQHLIESVPPFVFCSFVIPAPDCGRKTTGDIGLFDDIMNRDRVGSKMESNRARTWQSTLNDVRPINHHDLVRRDVPSNGLSLGLEMEVFDRHVNLSSAQ